MAPSKNQSHSTSNRNGESVGRQANILASAYCVDLSANLSGFHYSTTGAGGMYFYNTSGQSGIPEVASGIPSPPSSPPLAALTSANELALIKNSTRKREADGKRKSRKEGAAYTIREECERLFCETIKGVFLGDEGHTSSNGSIGMGANAHSPPDERVNGLNNYFPSWQGQPIDAWIEVWDYASGSSFRGFVGGKGETKSLFAFFDSSVVGREQKQGLMALIELAETVFAVTQVVICLDRSISEVDRKAFMKALRWVGFEAMTFDMWTGTLDTTSDKWLFLGMEI